MSIKIIILPSIHERGLITSIHVLKRILKSPKYIWNSLSTSLVRCLVIIKFTDFTLIR